MPFQALLLFPWVHTQKRDCWMARQHGHCEADGYPYWSRVLRSLLRLLRGRGGAKGAEYLGTVMLAAHPALKDAVTLLEYIDDSVYSPSFQVQGC